MIRKSAIDKFLVPLGKSYNIQCRRGMLRNNRFPEVVNEDKLSALDNYLKHENSTLYIEDLGNDLFHDVSLHVYNNGNHKGKGFPFVLRNAKEDLAGCMRSLYKKVENAIKDLKAE